MGPRHYTFLYTYSDLLTPATLLADIGRNPRTSPEALAKATLTPSNNPLVTLHLNTPLRIQGIVTGDFLTLLVRHAQIDDPNDAQHFVAYQEEDTMQYFLTALRDISSIPTRSEIVICHKGLRLDPASRFQDCNLPHEPTLHIRFSSHPDAHPRIEPTQPKSVGEAEDPPADPTNTLPSANRCWGTLREKCDTRPGKGYMGMGLWIRPPHASVQDPTGKTFQHKIPLHQPTTLPYHLMTVVSTTG